MINNSKQFRQTLEGIGLDRKAVDAVWPSWWSDEAENSKAALAELRFTVARRLGLAPTSLFDKDTPTFIWAHDAKFKGLTAFNGVERAAISSFGTAFGQILLEGAPHPDVPTLLGQDPVTLRSVLLKQNSFIRITDICALCWGLGVPVVHLRVFPLAAKRMAAMSIRVGGRYAILIGKDASYPASTIYHIAHEMAHIALGHLSNTNAIIDVEEPIENAARDKEEQEADRFALTLLTGMAEPRIVMNLKAKNGVELAAAVEKAAAVYGIEPGTLSLCYGHETGDWAVAHAALSHIYMKKFDVWKFLNRTAITQLHWDMFSDDNRAYVEAVLGAAHLA